jgi:RHS repeat-associated protein
MTTWTNFPNKQGAATTTWNYDPYRGFLSSKRYADNTGPDYTYTGGGRLNTRLWARTGTGGQRILTTYTYGFNDGLQNDHHGDLVGVAYSNDPQNTPAISYGYDRRGRQTNIVDGATTTTLTYNDANQVLSESYSGGPLANLAITSTYDSYLRRTSVSLNTQPSAIGFTNTFDAASRLQSVSDGTRSATYSYLANSLLVSQIAFTNAGSLRMVTTKSYDFLNRLTQIASTPSAASPISFAYSYNAANQRTRSSLADGSYWRFDYDPLGQVTSGKKYWSDQTPAAGQQFEYSFDTIGNRTSTKIGGDQNSANLRLATYLANNLNQYTSRSVTGAVEVTGVSFATNSIQVNGLTAYRKGEYFWQELLTNNTTAPLWMGVTASTAGQSNVIGNVFLAQTPEQFYYDSDGNLTNDGRWIYTWDVENRLATISSRTSVGPQQSLRFDYDWQGRRVSKKVWGNPSFSGNPAETHFSCDGWNQIAELSASNSVIRTYMWGLDLDGSSRGEAGVGGLVGLTYNGTQTTNCFPTFDGNGNVAALVDASTGTASAQYEYGPFAEVIRITGPMAKANPFRFSTKYQDDETDFLYYGYRYYNPATGRWIGRDRLEEIGGKNLYGTCENDLFELTDDLGEEVNWHHIFPQAVWNKFEEVLVKSGFTKDVLHSEQWGWMLDAEEHSFLHHKALEDDLNYVNHWMSWVRKQTSNGTKVLKLEKIAAHAQYIVKKSVWKDTFKVGVRAKWTYGVWGTVGPEIKAQVAKKIERLMLRRGARVGAEAASSEAPPIELGVDAFFFVCDLVNPDVKLSEAVLGNLPYIGVPYSIAKIMDKDKAIAKEMTERVYTQGDRTPPDFGVRPDNWSEDVTLPPPPTPR